MLTNRLVTDGNNRFVIAVAGSVGVAAGLAAKGYWPSAMLPILLLTALGVVSSLLSAESRKKPSLKYAIGMCVLCLPFQDTSAGVASGLAALGKFGSVMALLASISLFRHSLVRSGLSTLIAHGLSATGSGWGNSFKASLTSSLLTVLSSQGSIAIICAALRQRVREPLEIAKITNRSLCASMYVLPTTIASASVAMAIPHLDAGAVALFGAPVAAFVFFGAVSARLDFVKDDGAGAAVDKRKALMLAGLVIAVGAAAFVATRQMTWAFAVAMFIGYILEITILSEKINLLGKMPEASKSIDGIAPELLLLAAAGFTIFTVSHSNLLANLPEFARAFLDMRGVVLAVLIVLLPLVTVAGVHPMILFGLFFPLIQPDVFVAPHVQYLAWITMFVMANLLSPVSITALVAATSLQKTSVETSYKTNWRFCASLMALTYGYLFWLSTLIVR